MPNTGFTMKARVAGGIAVLAVSVIFTLGEAAQSPSQSPVADLAGVYEIVPNDFTLPGGQRNQGSPEEIALLPAAAEVAQQRDLSLDTAKDCQGIGAFRMMAREKNLMEIAPALSTGRVFILFEDTFLGIFRMIILDRPHDPERAPAYNGDSVGRWENDRLVVETTNFNDYIWLNALGAPKSEALRLTETYRLIEGGEYLELRMTAEDPNVLAEPYTYTRYYKRLDNMEIPQYVCTDDLIDHQIPGLN